MKGKISFRSELILCCVGIVLVTMVAQIGFNTYFARSVAIQDKEQEIEELFTYLEANYTDDPREIYGLVGDAQHEKNLRIQIIGEQGMIYNSEVVDSGIPAEEEWTRPLTLPRGNPPTAQTDSDMVRLEETIAYNGEARTIVIWSSVVAIESAVDLFTKSNVVVSCAVMGLAILGVIFFAGRFTKPVCEVEAVAQNVANLDFDKAANEKVSTRELASLARSINTMSLSLESMIEKMSADNASLTNKVEYQEKLEAMRRQFVANISHEMKTPLSMLMMYSESLQMDVPGIDKDYYCATIREEAAGLNAMVAQLLDISSVENGLSQLQCKEMNYSEFVSDVVEKTKVLLENFQVEQSIDSGIWISGDRKYLEQAIRNYLTNANSHTTEGGTITITLQQEDGKARFAVKNQGQSIAQEDLPHIWDSFYRADKARTQTAQKRVGLGLYLVKTCINAHQGDVGVTNGDGFVEFDFQIPIISQ
ncbi:MAG: HAMP domain-containing sensor histidine kinase [Eubacteriales bacterium]